MNISSINNFKHNYNFKAAKPSCISKQNDALKSYNNCRINCPINSNDWYIIQSINKFINSDAINRALEYLDKMEFYEQNIDDFCTLAEFDKKTTINDDGEISVNKKLEICDDNEKYFISKTHKLGQPDAQDLFRVGGYKKKKYFISHTKMERDGIIQTELNFADSKSHLISLYKYSNLRKIRFEFINHDEGYKIEGTFNPDRDDKKFEIDKILKKSSPLSFKGNYVVAVNKEAFSEPDNLEKCQDEFDSELSSYLPAKRKFFSYKPQYISFLEAPGYIDVVNSSKYNLNWKRLHSRIDIKEPAYKDYHAFRVVTKDEKDALVKKYKNMKMVEKTINEEQKTREMEGKIADDVWICARIYQILNNMFNNATKDSTKETILIDSLDKIDYVVSEMDV